MPFVRITYLLSLLLIGLSASTQLKFDSRKVSDSILRCAQNIARITENPYFDNIDSLRSNYSHEIWMKMPFASNAELYELTNYPNKYVRRQAFDLLLQFRDMVDTALDVLEKNVGDSVEFFEELTGDVLYKYSVFERMVMNADEWWIIQSKTKPDLLTPEQKRRLNRLKAYLKKL